MDKETYKKILDRLSELIAGTRFENHVYAVGGCVRDSIMGREIKDIDLVVEIENGGIALSQDLHSRGLLNHAPVIYENYGTTMFRLKEFPDLELEAVQTRKEQYHSDSRNPVTSFGTLSEDATRRDLTVNALYYNISSRSLLDPTGGIADMNSRIIRVTSTPEIVYQDDPLRILRAIRFYGQFNSSSKNGKWKIDRKTYEGMKANARRLEIISKERIAVELHKMLLTLCPAECLEMLRKTGAMHYVFPELESTYNITQNEFHFGTVWEHTLKVVENARRQTDDLNIMMAALLHDIGKIETRSEGQDGRVHFYEHEFHSEKMIPTMLRRLHEPVDMMNEVSTLSGAHMMAKSWKDDLSGVKVINRSVRKMQYRFGKTLFNKLMIVIDADNNAHAPEHNLPDQVRRIKEVSRRLEDLGTDMFGYELPVNGNDVMEVRNIKPSREVRDCLDYLIKLAYNDPLISREDCLRQIKSWKPGEKKKAKHRN